MYLEFLSIEVPISQYFSPGKNNTNWAGISQGWLDSCSMCVFHGQEPGLGKEHQGVTFNTVQELKIET